MGPAKCVVAGVGDAIWSATGEGLVQWRGILAGGANGMSAVPAGRKRQTEDLLVGRW